MSEKLKIDEFLIESAKLESIQITDSELLLIDKVIQDFAPEIGYLYQIREDESEEQQIKTGRLHENRILGIILEFYLKGKKKITTSEVEQEYKKYFKEIARSTISTYLNMLKKESTLYKERDGRIVYYIFYEAPPKNIKPFWFTRLFCIVPAYFNRALFFSNFYFRAEEFVTKYIKDYHGEDKNILIRNFKFLIGLIILNIFKNRVSKCVLCQFSKREMYTRLEEILEIAIKDRSDVLSEDMITKLIDKYSEVTVFNGTDLIKEKNNDKIIDLILKYADDYKKDFDFQIMVSNRRESLRLKQR
ncbi:MAG: hypothetical protein ACFFHD_05040, partial [Promethearchaeota archaeon]